MMNAETKLYDASGNLTEVGTDLIEKMISHNKSFLENNSELDIVHLEHLMIRSVFEAVLDFKLKL